MNLSMCGSWAPATQAVQAKVSFGSGAGQTGALLRVSATMFVLTSDQNNVMSCPTSLAKILWIRTFEWAFLAANCSAKNSNSTMA